MDGSGGKVTVQLLNRRFRNCAGRCFANSSYLKAAYSVDDLKVNAYRNHLKINNAFFDLYLHDILKSKECHVLNKLFRIPF